MADDVRSQLRALVERELPHVLERAAADPPLVTDRAALALFAELLRDGPGHRQLLEQSAEEQRAWLVARWDDIDRPLAGASEDAGDTACVREAAQKWVTQYFEGALAPSAEPGLWGHLEDCAACRARYSELQARETEGDDAVARRIKRLTRGLPWSDVEEPPPAPDEAEQIADEPEPEDVAETPAQEPPAEERAAAEAAAETAGQPPQRFWLTRRGRLTMYVVAALLFVVANVYLVLMPKTHAFELPEEAPAPPVVKPLPPQGLALALLTYQPQVMHDMPWRNVQGAVAAGDRLLLTYSLEEGQQGEKGKPRYLTIVAMDDRGRLHWLRPAVREAAGVTSPGVRVPARAVKLPRELRAPSGVERLVIYAVVTDRPVALERIRSALTEAFHGPDFFNEPPVLDVERSLQHHRVLDVLK